MNSLRDEDCLLRKEESWYDTKLLSIENHCGKIRAIINQARKGLRLGIGGRSSQIMISFSSISLMRSDLRLLRLEDRWMVGS